MSSLDDIVWRRWSEVDPLFAAALEQAPARRDSFLATACGDDLELYHAVISLVDDSETAPPTPGPGPRLLRAWAADHGEEVPPELGLKPGDRLDRYRIEGELGRGGMATVYSATRADGVFEQRVAIKVLRRGLDTEEVVRRFLAERHILSELTHPNIASILDGGATEDGRPYLVMQRIEGRPITRWADERRLDVRARTELFLQVADAMSFAHSRLVVHRDIKPSNVLVDGQGRAVLLDFGIAKLLAPPEERIRDGTLTGTLPLTPEYASPEHARGEPVTTASDVYQLGVLLYLLLTGRRPFPDAPPRIHLGMAPAEPQAPSDAFADDKSDRQRALKGDLDTIILKAMRHEPDERYRSVEAMADDLRRHLAGRPIEARPRSVRYHLRKFVGRNPWFPPVAALFALGIGGYVTTLQIQSDRLERERNAAQLQAQRAQQLRTFLVELFQPANPYDNPNPTRSRELTVVEAMELGVERARNELDNRPALRADLLSSIAGVYEGLDLREPALDLLGEALEIRRGVGTARSAEQLADLERVASLLTRAGLVDSARTVQQEHLALARELEGREPAIARGLLGLSDIAGHEGERELALEHGLEAVSILRALDPRARGDLAVALSSLADSYRQFDRLDEAEAAAREGLEIGRHLWGDEHPRTAEAEVHLAQLLHARGRLEDAVDLYQTALPKLEAALGPLHFITINSLNNLGTLLLDSDDVSGAEAVHREVLERRRRVPGGDSLAVASSLQNLASTVIRHGRLQEADSFSVEAEALYRRHLPDGHPFHAFPLMTRTEVRLREGDGLAAERLARRASAMLESALPAGHYARAVARCRIGAALARQGRIAEAAPLIRVALSELEATEQAPSRTITECRSALDRLEGAVGAGSGISSTASPTRSPGP